MYMETSSDNDIRSTDTRLDDETDRNVRKDLIVYDACFDDIYLGEYDRKAS